MVDAVSLLNDLPVWLLAVAWAFDVAIRVLMLGIVPGNRRPTTAMAWLLAIFFIPALGLALFLLFGNFKLSDRRTQKQLQVNRRILESTQHLESEDVTGDAPEWLESVVFLNRQLGAFPMHSGNRFDFITDYKRSIEAMTGEIERAEKYVHVQFYIIGDDDEYVSPFLEALERAVQRGVNVRVLFDHLGTLRVDGYRNLKRRLTGAGIEWHPMLPVSVRKWRWRRPDLRNHRKLVIVDGKVAFTGSQNLIEPGYKREAAHRIGREWMDIMARVEGPLVTGLDIVFATDWYQESDDDLLADVVAGGLEPSRGETRAQIVPSGPGFESENNLRLFNTLVYGALERLTITSPYFVPDDSLLYAITTAAQRGVRVELFVSERGDQFLVNHAQQSYYAQLLKAGVRIFRYRQPTVLHTKCLTVDDTVAVFGSSNMDMRSFSLNREVSIMMLGAEVVEEVNRVQDEYRLESKELTLEEWAARKPAARWLDNVCRLTATLQ
ncbi:cardiolipin synthase [Zhihengliuella sp.]|uniref:cardiolipin synthase n=1 Tax=Zhihengliuella sp. TaxID=1954483 RepID=UPI002811ABBA|nr:cardiolipin synthase [Zhihengliuella sp.]